MRTISVIRIIVIGLTTHLLAKESLTIHENNWPQWRGPLGIGVSPSGNPPVEWSENKNVKWKIDIPGRGHSTPIIWGNQLFITTSIPTDVKAKVGDESENQEGGQRGMPLAKTDNIHRFVVLSINRDTGKILWQRTVCEEHPEDRTHEFGSWASNSAVTDGQNVYAYFGSRGLYCLDMKGNIIWQRDFGQLEKVRSFGEGSSPVLYKDRIIVLWDHEGQSFIIALDKKTGQDVWKVDRDEISSWSTPSVVEFNGRTQVVTSATNRVRSYDPDTGNLIWECSGMTRNVIPTPLFSDGLVYVYSGFRGSALLAIDLKKAEGDISGSDAIVWQYNQSTPYAPSPMIWNNKLYMLRGNDGRLTCLGARNGNVYYSEEKLEGIGNVFASLVGARDRIYVSGRKGVFYVVKQGPQFQILSKNELDDEFKASPVIIANDLYLRGHKHLYCISPD